MSVSQAQTTFINATKFAVIGRVLTDRSRWDNKVLRWYMNHDLQVTPILPAGSQQSERPNEVEGLTIISDPSTLPDLPTTSISIIINPKIGIQILKSLYPIDSRRTRSSGPNSIWFQPGAESEEIKQYVKEMGLEGKVVCNGECILEEGDDVLRKRSASESGGASRL